MSPAQKPATTAGAPAQPASNSSRSALVLALVSVGLQGIAAAQEPAPATPPTQLIEIIGTSPNGDGGALLSNYPGNAQILRARQIAAQGATNLADLLNDNVGSVTVSGSTGSPYQNDVNYRGFQATSLLGAPVGLSVYFDGVRMNEPFGSVVNWDLIPMNAIASLEIVPGSNPVYGLNTLGGALVAKTKNGSDDAGASIELLGGSFGRRTAQFEFGGASRAGSVDYFVAGNVDRQDGFRPFSRQDVKQFYGKLRWRSDDAMTRAELSTALADTNLHGTQSLPEDMLGDITSTYTAPDSTANRMGLVGLKLEHRWDEANRLAGHVHYRHARSLGMNSNAGLDDGCFNSDGSLATSGSGYKCANQAPDGTALDAVTGANALALGYGRWTSTINTSVVESTTTTNATGASLQWTHSGRLFERENKLVAGASLDRSRISFDQTSYLARLLDRQTVIIANQAYGYTNSGAPSPSNLPQFTGSNILGGVTLASTTRDASLFFADTLELTDRLSASLSGSFNATTLDQSGANNQYLNDDGGWTWTDDVTGVAYYNPGYLGAYKYANSGAGYAATPLAAPKGAVAGPESNDLAGHHAYRRFNPSIGFDYRLNRSDNLFGSYSEAMRAPTSIELSCADPDSPCALPTGFNGDPDLKAVVAKTIELGARGRLGDHLSWNAAVYDSRLSNDIQFIATSTSYGYFANVGDTERRGLELNAQVRLAPWFVSLNYGYVAAKYKSAFTTPAGVAVVSGNRIPGIPASSFKVRTAYEGHGWSAGANLVAVGGQFMHGNESNEDPAGRVPGYAVVNLDAHVTLAPGLTLSGYVNNLLDRRYATYGLSGQTSIYTLATQPFVTPAPPRGVWLALKYAFGGRTAHRDD